MTFIPKPRTECRACINPDLLRDRTRNVTRAELCGECLFKRSQLRKVGPVELACFRPGCENPVRRWESQMGRYKKSYCTAKCMGEHMTLLAAERVRPLCFCGQPTKAKGMCMDHYKLLTGQKKHSGPWAGYIKLLFAENLTANAQAQRATKAQNKTNKVTAQDAAIEALVAQYGQAVLDTLKKVQADQQVE